jgi:hypothetical protein
MGFNKPLSRTANERTTSASLTRFSPFFGVKNNPVFGASEAIALTRASVVIDPEGSHFPMGTRDKNNECNEDSALAL